MCLHMCASYVVGPTLDVDGVATRARARLSASDHDISDHGINPFCATPVQIDPP